MTTLPTFTIKDMIEAGVHFGHKAMRWNPEMAPYIYTTRDGIHIIDLQQTAVLLHRALQTIQNVAKGHGKILFVGTKRQASEHIREAALRCGQFYVDKRWLGGTLTNWKTVSKSIKTMQDMEKALAESESGQGLKLTKKESLEMTRKIEKLEKSLGGIREMNGKPDLIFVLDTNKENLAVKEAQKLSIPIVAIVDTNCYPHGITHIVPGNDDATRAIKLYCQLVSDAVLSGVEQSLISSGVDIHKVKEEIKEFAQTESNTNDLNLFAEAAIEAVVEAEKPKAAKKPAKAEIDLMQVAVEAKDETPKAKKSVAKDVESDTAAVEAPKAKKAPAKKAKDA